ncbi:MAG: MoaD/ThiS family protein [Candidatus Eremiobacteraeota bacterium]|nr:MoaD/ThiS family protein [Candidatus Eremiobacteraeota bacterium]
MTVRVRAFAGLRELLGRADYEVRLSDGAVADNVWDALAAEFPALAEYRPSTRIARNGVMIDGAEPLAEGDEIALMPPFGGG